MKELKSVLIIENKPQDAELLVEYLSDSKNYQYKTFSTREPWDTFWILRKQHINVIILHLPESKGADTLAYYLDRVGATPIIVVSGAEDNELEIQLVKMGAEDCLYRKGLNANLVNKAVGFAVSKTYRQNKLNQLYRIQQTIISVYKLISNGGERKGLLLKTCELVVRTNGYTNAWIIFTDKRDNIIDKASFCSDQSVVDLFSGCEEEKLPRCLTAIKNNVKCNVKVIPDDPCPDCAILKPGGKQGVSSTALSYKGVHYGFIGVTLPSGLISWNEGQGAFLELSKGLSLALYGIFSKEPQESLRKKLALKDEKFRLIAENSVNCIWQLDTRLNIQYISPAVKQLVNYTPVELVNKNLISLVGKRGFIKMARMSIIAQNRGNAENSVRFKTSIINRNGDNIPVEIISKVIWHSDGSLLGYQGSIVDISERVRAEEEIQSINEILKWKNEELQKNIESIREINIELKTKDKRLEMLLKAAKIVLQFESFESSALKILKLCKRCTESHEAWLALFEGTNGQVSVISKLIGTNRTLPLETLNAGIKAFVKETGSFSFYNSEQCKKLFKEIGSTSSCVNLSVAPLRINKKVVGMLAVCNNNKHLKFEEEEIIKAVAELCSIALYNVRMNEKLVQAKEHAEESDNLKTAFLSNMSHEIRTPLNGIMGFSQFLMADGYSTEERKGFHTIMTDSCNRLLRIVNDIIDISKIESNTLSLSLKNCNISKIVHDCHVSFLHASILLENKNIELERGPLDEFYAEEIETDPVRLRQVLDNLVNNALKYTEKGTVKMGCSLKKYHSGDYIEFYVSDTGLGIPREKQDMVFHRFRQVEEGGYQQGAGLGLSIAHGLVELLGGEIWFDSEHHVGSNFYFTIPYIKAYNAEEQVEVKPTSHIETLNSLHGQSVIIAEDDRNSYLYLLEILGELSLCIEHAENGQVLMEMLENEEPDLILLDINMPKKSGFDCLKEIKQRGIKSKIIAQTAYALTAERDKCMEYGCDEYISKPIQRERLYGALARTLGPSIKMQKIIKAKRKTRENFRGTT